MNILLSSAGRRVSLLGCFREALDDLGLQGSIIAIDCAAGAPAGHFADGFYQVPACSDPAFLPEVAEICSRKRVHMLVPTIDPELPVFAGGQQELRQAGVEVIVSSPETVEICSDKAATHRWLLEHGFPTVRQEALSVALERRSSWTLPAILKPRSGSASAGVRSLSHWDEIAGFNGKTASFLIEEIAPGEEYTVNVFVDLGGRCLCAVPHRRLAVRGGEVSKGVTVKNLALMDLARAVAESLPGARGPLNIQCFVEPGGGLKIIEINPRFGGGYPLAHRAGARFTHWILDQVKGRGMETSFDGWQDDLAMLRYDRELFLPGTAMESLPLGTL